MWHLNCRKSQIREGHMVASRVKCPLFACFTYLKFRTPPIVNPETRVFLARKTLGLFFWVRCLNFFSNFVWMNFPKYRKTPEIFVIIFSFCQEFSQGIPDSLVSHGFPQITMCFDIGFHRVSCIPIISLWS